MKDEKRIERRDIFINDATKLYNGIYDYSNIAFVNVKSKIEIYCIKHKETFKQTPQMHLRGSGCKQCISEKLSTAKTKDIEDFISQAVKIHGDKYNFDDVIYKHSHSKIYPICKIHGKFETTPSIILSGSGCRYCSIDKQKIKHDDLLSEFTKVHGNKYKYSNIEYINSNTKIDIICSIEGHGTFKQTPSGHKHGRGCPKCKADGMRYDTATFVKLANIKHNNLYDYSKTVYTGTKDNIIVICKKHGEFITEPNGHLSNGRGCPKCAHHISSGEITLTKVLNSYVNVSSSVRDIIPPKELDIYIPSKQVAIEYNGIYWHGETKGCNKQYHRSKTLDCNAKGIRLIHIFDVEWINKQKIVKSRLKNILGFTKYKLYGRKCTIKEIDTKTKTKFMNKYHIQGAGKSSIKLGAFYKNRLVAIMTFGKRRFDDNEGFELVRYATIASFSCVGVAGKLLKHFELTYNPKAIISYADLRWSEGGVYNALGFEHIHNSNPNYFYTKGGIKVGSRIEFQKHKLKDKLKTFDPNKTEWENMKANGYDRIWDCGNMVFEKYLN